jgi:hypothetical protein
MKRVLILAAALTTTAVALRAEAQPFNSVHELTTWYTDQALIDIEIIGSSSMLPEFHRLQPERTLRFRLERAYVDWLTTKSDPGFETVHFSFDLDTRQPASLFAAVGDKGRFYEPLPAIPLLPNEQRLRRLINISISSDASSTALQQLSDVYRKECTGAAVGDGLWIFEWKDRPECQRPTYPKGVAYVADYDGSLALRIECQEESFPGTGCSLNFPFEGFAVTLSFHRDHLQDWRGMIDRASDFLHSKEYH